MKEETYYTVEEVAKLLKINKRQVIKMIKANKLQAIDISTGYGQRKQYRIKLGEFGI